MIKKTVLTFILLLIASIIIYYFLPEEKLPANITIDNIIVLKSHRQLSVYSNGRLIKVYRISLGSCPIGKKKFANDGKTPEGHYFINAKNPHSVCYKNLGISYPNQNDILNARKLNISTGGDIKIHGISNRLGFIGKFQRWYNWTAGCIALTNTEVDDLYNHTPIGTPIEIKP